MKIICLSINVIKFKTSCGCTFIIFLNNNLYTLYLGHDISFLLWKKYLLFLEIFSTTFNTLSLTQEPVIKSMLPFFFQWNYILFPKPRLTAPPKHTYVLLVMILKTEKTKVACCQVRTVRWMVQYSDSSFLKSLLS